MLTTVHHPFDTRVFHKEAKSLAKMGHNVTIIAPHDEEINEIRDGVHIQAIRKPKPKAFHFLTMWKVFSKGLKGDFDVYHCHEPGSLFVCSILKMLKRKRMVYDIHEHYPGLIAENSFFPSILKKPIFRIVVFGEKVFSKYADYLITVDDILENRFKQVNSKIAIINNYPRLELFNHDLSEINKNNRKTIIYVGGLTKIRGTLETIKSFELVLEKIPDAKLYFVGDFIHPEYEKEVMDYYYQHNLENSVIFTGRVDHNEVSKYIKQATVAVGLLQPNPRYELAIPVKLFEYMAAGKAVIMSDFKYTAQFLKENNCGIAVDPTDIQQIADSMVSMLQDLLKTEKMGENGRKAVETTYNWELMEMRLSNLYEELK